MVAAVGMAALLVVACGGPAEEVVAEEPVTEPAASEEVEQEPEEAEGSEGPEDDANEVAEASTGDPAAGPLPDPDRLADPCAAHEGREMDSFIDLVAPVQDQVVGDEVELVGCSNVHEATVVWHVLDGDGELLDEGFTTATCGTGCVGEFSDVVPLEAAAGEPVAYLQVFSPNMADEGPEQLELVEVMVVLQ